MAILVDEARWPWRDNYWCHLVSDSDLAELHDFAGQLGCRRVGFQGDHYDIDVQTRTLAIELGAEPCPSRELVRRLRGADLRLRPSQFTKWSLAARGETVDSSNTFVDDFLAPFAEAASGFFALTRERSNGQRCAATVLYGDAPVELPPEDAARGRFVRLERNGTWSVEVISPPPTDRE